jgi:hypothetical protein
MVQANYENQAFYLPEVPEDFTVLFMVNLAKVKIRVIYIWL